MAIVVSEETGVISLVMDGDIERSVDPDRARGRRLAALIRAGGRSSRRGSRVLAELMARIPVPQRRPQVPVDLHRGAAVAGRRRRSGRRARAARADRVSEPAPGPRDRRRSAGVGRRPPARVVGHVGTPRSGGYVRRHRFAERAARTAAVPPDADADQGAVRRGGRAGGAGDAADRRSRTRRFGSCRCGRRSRDARRRDTKWRNVTTDPATVEVVGPRARSAGSTRR